MKCSRALLLIVSALVAGCGRVADLEPAPGHALPVKPMMARNTPTAADLLTLPPYARPDRVDEIMKKSEPRRHDPFDLAPPSGGAAPAVPAGTVPEPAGQTTGKTTDTPGE